MSPKTEMAVSSKSKSVPLYPSPQAGQCCPVNILDTYITRLPLEAKEKDLFYVCPLDKVAAEPNNLWYSAVPLGKHTLQLKMKCMCASGGIKGHKTNHSLRATAATEMFRCVAPEKLIQERNGHRSIEALRTYEHLEESQHKAVSSLISNAGSSHFSTTFVSSTHTSNFNCSNSYATDISSKSQGMHD